MLSSMTMSAWRLLRERELIDDNWDIGKTRADAFENIYRLFQLVRLYSDKLLYDVHMSSYIGVMVQSIGLPVEAGKII